MGTSKDITKEVYGTEEYEKKLTEARARLRDYFTGLSAIVDTSEQVVADVHTVLDELDTLDGVDPE